MMDSEVRLPVTACSNGNECALTSGSIDGFRNHDELKYKYVSGHEKRVAINVVTYAHIDTPGSADEAIFALRGCRSWQLTALTGG